jgi:threonine/homoserine/homoserine lactone efflux protein
VNFASLFSGLLLGYSLAVPPGPMNALIAAWSLRSFHHGFAVGAGAMSADSLLMLLTLTLYGGGNGFSPPSTRLAFSSSSTQPTR